MTQAAVLRLCYLSTHHRLTQEEICKVQRESRAAHKPQHAVTLATIERTVKIVVAARVRAASQPIRGGRPLHRRRAPSQ
jgi:hypothetical protein